MTATAKKDRGELTVSAPKGAHFEMEEVKSKRGEESLGMVPILVWDDVDSGVEYYGEEGVKRVWNGTSLRVSFQSIARRYAIAGEKSTDDIATAQIEFKPGTRNVGAATPASRAARAAKKASETVDGDAVTKLLEMVASGKLGADQIAAITGSAVSAPALAEDEEAEEE